MMNHVQNSLQNRNVLSKNNLILLINMETCSYPDEIKQ